MRLLHKISRSELKPGDHIYTYRKLYLYSHHGIYVGEGKTIHFIGRENTSLSSSASFISLRTPCPRCGDESDHPDEGVILSCLDCFLEQGKLYRYEYNVSQWFFYIARGGTCTLTPSDPPEDVLIRAYYLFYNGGFGQYSLVKNNCEDFALYCKTDAYDRGRSGQVEQGLTSISVLAAAFTVMIFN